MRYPTLFALLAPALLLTACVGPFEDNCVDGEVVVTAAGEEAFPDSLVLQLREAPYEYNFHGLFRHTAGEMLSFDSYSHDLLIAFAGVDYRGGPPSEPVLQIYTRSVGTTIVSPLARYDCRNIGAGLPIPLTVIDTTAQRLRLPASRGPMPR